MKLAIIGGGLFGCNIANELSNIDNSSVHIYEKNNELFKQASSNNQHRFHTGFHYPRSPQTIEQIDIVSESFKQKFSDCIFDIKNNYYFVSNTEDSKISFTEYKNIFFNKSKEIKSLKDFEKYLLIEKIDGGLISNECGINLQLLKQRLINLLLKNNIKVFLNTEWIDNNKQNYDFIINCSYINPNLTTDKIRVKYEICELLLIENPFKELSDYSMTIMDGNYSSLYATENKNAYTLSNVEKTPFFKTNELKELQLALKNINDFNFDFIENEILEKTKEYYKIDKVKKLGRYITPKVKPLYDINDLRTTEVLYEGKFVTLLQGKISTIQHIAQQINNYVRNQ